MSTTLTGSLVLPDRILHGTLTLANGKIECIEEGFVQNPTYDYRGKYLLPGLLEVHGHLREPGLEYKEDIEHGSRAALAGGYTTVFDMPNTKPPTTTVARVKEQIQRYEQKSYTDFAINMGTSLEDRDELKAIDTSLITGVKIFAAGHATTPTTIGRISDIASIFEILGERHIMALIHAENQELVNYFTHHYRTVLGRNDPPAWSEARNGTVVLTSVLEMIALAKHFGVKLYLLHQSTPEEFAAIAFGRSIGVDVYGEVLTFHLAFNTDDYATHGNLINVSPSVRSPEVQKRLWQLLREGVVDTVVTDHAPHTLEEKHKESAWDVASGIPGFQESLPILITGWLAQFGHETLDEGLIRIGQVTSQNIARIFDFPQKGGLIVGKDADIVVIDTDNTWTVQKSDLFTKNQWSAYEGKTFVGRPTATFLRGTQVYQHGNIIGEAQGRRVERHL